MTDTEIREEILKVFRTERKNPNVPYVEEHFLDFLTGPPHGKNTIRNSFRGVKKYHQFMNQLELNFTICFTLPDLDRYYTVDQLTKKVKERINKRRGNIMIIKQRVNEKGTYKIELLLTAIVAVSFTIVGLHWFSILLTLFWAIAIYWIFSSKVRDKRHNKKLKVLILNQRA